MRTTPLLPCHEKRGARLIDFSGWVLPVQYEGILAEHHATRRHAAIFDTCHMGRFVVTGPAAREALLRLITCDLALLGDGQCRYGFLLNEKGGILDDLIVYRVSAQQWMLVVNAGTREKDRDWIGGRLPAGATLTDESDRVGKVDVQGPESPRLVSAVLQTDVTSLPHFRFTDISYRGKPLRVSRTGYTGETGYELYAEAGDIVALWDACVAAGATPAGLGARDTLRLEAALPLYGHELSEEVTPVEANLLRFVRKEGGYIGEAALRARAAAGSGRRLAGFRLEGRQSARAGNPAARDGREAGRVTSGSFSPTLGYAIGLAYLDEALTKAGEYFTVDTGRKDVKARTVSLPFYRRPTP